MYTSVGDYTDDSDVTGHGCDVGSDSLSAERNSPAPEKSCRHQTRTDPNKWRCQTQSRTRTSSTHSLLKHWKLDSVVYFFYDHRIFIGKSHFTSYSTPPNSPNKTITAKTKRKGETNKQQTNNQKNKQANK